MDSQISLDNKEFFIEKNRCLLEEIFFDSLNSKYTLVKWNPVEVGICYVTLFFFPRFVEQIQNKIRISGTSMQLLCFEAINWMTYFIQNKTKTFFQARFVELLLLWVIRMRQDLNFYKLKELLKFQQKWYSSIQNLDFYSGSYKRKTIKIIP